jgi:tricorn protease interacting factor F2/3
MVSQATATPPLFTDDVRTGREVDGGMATPTDLTPGAVSRYRLNLTIDAGELTWAGWVEFDPPSDSLRILLDSEDLEITCVTRNGEISAFHYDTEAHQLAIPLDPELPCTVRVEFKGKVVPNRLDGLYRSRHGDGFMLTTQCQQTSARRIFPCVDRPDRKARIALSVRAPAGREVVSNMPVETVAPIEGGSEWVFACSPPMATYVFCLAIGRFDRAESLSAGRVPIRVLTPASRGESGKFAAEAAARILTAYEQYYGIPYALPKLDLIAVPEHPFGAMENWGAITVQDTLLLVDPESPTWARPAVFGILAHEIAHQWFGDLATMTWWDDLWLNEGFATFLGAKITDQLAPEFQPRAGLILRPYEMRDALDCDSLRATHAIREPVEGVAAVAQVVDAILYGKGSSVVRMLDAYLGETEFRRGVSEYLGRFRFRNARTEDLWDSLGQSAGRPVSSIVTPWIQRPGLPVIHVKRSLSGLELRQSRFAYLGVGEEPPWPIPLVCDIDGRSQRVLFESREIALSADPLSTVHLNPGALGFYRVCYDSLSYARLLRSLSGRSPIDRWIVLNDLAAFVLSQDVGWETYAEFATTLGTGSDLLVSTELTSALSDFALMVPDSPRVGDVARSYLARLTECLSPERRPGELAEARILRGRATLARAKIDGAYARSLSDRFEEWDTLDPDLKAAVAVSRARMGGRAGWDEIVRALQQSPNTSEVENLENALAWSGDASLVRETLALAITGSLKQYHIAEVIVHAARNPIGRPLVGPWLETNLAIVLDRFRGMSFRLDSLFERAIPFAGLGRAEATASFYRSNPVPEAARSIARGLERLEFYDRFRMHIAG